VWVERDGRELARLQRLPLSYCRTWLYALSPVATIICEKLLSRIPLTGPAATSSLYLFHPRIVKPASPAQTEFSTVSRRNHLSQTRLTDCIFFVPRIFPSLMRLQGSRDQALQTRWRMAEQDQRGTRCPPRSGRSPVNPCGAATVYFDRPLLNRRLE
jgi:hypothetical protein